MKSLIILNWKMNLTQKPMISLMKQIVEMDVGKELIIAPSCPFLAMMTREYPQYSYATQDVSIYNQQGAYTGEISADIVKSCGVEYAMIGHSERRTLMQEDDQILQQKLSNVVKAGMVPIFCVGETLEARKSEQQYAYIAKQLQSIPKDVKDIIVAYEPIWSIGTGIVPTIDEISQMLRFIRDNRNFIEVANSARLVYGGSVTSSNCQSIMQIDAVDGVLVGSAALKADQLKIILS